MSADWDCRTALPIVVCGDQALIVVTGELDLLRHDALRTALAGAADADLILDLTNVSFVDASTISLLARAAEKRQAAGWQTAIVNCQPTVSRVFRLTHAQHLLSA